MRLFIRLLILFAMAVGLAVGARYNPGNVVLFYPPYRIDISLNFFLFLTLVLFVVLYLVMRTIVTTQKMPRKVAMYRQGKRERDGNKALRESLKALFEGRFGHAEKAALRAVELPDNAAVAALIAARAAHHMGQFERRDSWFASTEADMTYKTARLVTMTELLVDQHKAEQALDAVKELHASGTRHIQVLRWALKANQQAKKWPEVLKLVRTLDKHRALHPALSNRLRELAYEDLLTDHGHDAESLRRVWYEIPADDRKNRFVAFTAAKSFNERGLHEDARVIVEKTVAEEWDDRLMRIYRDAAASEGSVALLGQIEHCERWTIQRPTDPELALTLGTLCLKQKLWGKAQRHMEQALSDATESRTVRESNLKLAQLHEALGQADEAAQHYRQCAIATML
ncbi:heme biosynthesis HemY N-terminal domain-containing protein [Undibacterium sp. RTI2.1]|uniref:heme biosynthesis HemY N-terminal domain-containing protein n=1 Tax=unclassified Undibacterium TaxID=2630295 RepID=UPI002AB443BC|nr:MULTISPECIES: heme biosynthesis HemY N-terminal domain-containing protein [unclassified Undibacterium]MDY7537212.1 heme biosynthesis HemY N-terminal domain-containing protein [Undibacterium sp. 5I1]MEB0031337.1 heme biosynthesis HemY N-terminal domain-containing protein [Undibacterium sp. RTI2.1]MEB0117706.1 heme biosynthesis HemY N-terminal domain-containing protein [Undibacterium sp. RTI2.2]MEB0231501.1 heme biosynthesis HemY N-terminal domain-containing protein [Undibacterium sp. 10I3]ME